MGKVIEGAWPENDLRRAFVTGAKWWEWHKTKFTMWQSDQRLTEIEADKRYPGGQCARPNDQKPPRLNPATGTANVFKFRAEDLYTVNRLQKVLGKEIVKKGKMRVIHEELGIGVLMEMETTETLDAIKDAIRKVSDSHIMLQTVAPKDEYTGERRYDDR